MNNYLEKARPIYEAELTDYLSRNKIEVSEHIRQIMLEVVLNKNGINTFAGSFVKAIINNNLYDAIRYADVECAENLVEIVVVCLNFQLPYSKIVFLTQ